MIIGRLETAGLVVEVSARARVAIIAAGGRRHSVMKEGASAKKKAGKKG